MVGQVIDISANGIGIWLPEPVPSQATLIVEAGELEITGEVCYCQPDQGGFRAGLFVKERHLREVAFGANSGSLTTA